MRRRTGLLRMLLLLLLLAPQVQASRAQDDHGFRFVRIRYEDSRPGGMRWGGAAWSHDYPAAEHNFYEALRRTTKIHVEEPPLVLTLKDERIFEYPVLYLCEPGYWPEMDEEEQRNLTEYLKRGGFVLFDDFGGDREWLHFYEQMKRIFPNREPVEIPPDHPIWSIYFEIDPVEAPANVSGGRGGFGRFSKYDDRYMAFFDDNGRMMALACHNQDIGDGWEWPERNLENASTISFQMGVNFLMYALTH